MPVAFKSFGDYKPPLMIYLLSIVYGLFSIHEIYIRIFSAVAGILSILVIFFLAKSFFVRHSQKNLIALASAGTLAVSPWSIHLSRVGFEQNTAFLFGLLSIWLFMAGLKKPVLWWGSSLFCAMSMLTFHTAKIFLPAVFLILIFANFKTALKHKYYLGISLCLFLMVMVPYVYTGLKSSAFARAGTLIVFDQSGNLRGTVEIMGIFVKNLTAFMRPNFWVNGFDAVSIRHAVPGHGVILYPSLLLLLVSVVNILVTKSKTGLILIGVLLTGLLPSILADPVPHVLRSQFSLIGVALISGFGVSNLGMAIKSKKVFQFLIFGIIFASIIQLSKYMDEYFNEYAVASALEHQYGYDLVFKELKAYSDRKAVISDIYGQPYIYALVYNRIMPQQFLWGGLNNFEFHPIDWKRAQKGVVYVGSPAEIPINDPAVKSVISVPNSNIIAWVIAAP